MKTLFSTWLILSMLTLPIGAAEIYVAPDGDDAASGTKEKPLKSLEAARAAARISHSSGEFVIWLRGGVHQRSSTLVLTAGDSGTEKAPIVYRAYRDEKPIISVARQIAPGEWRKVTDEAIIKRLPAEAREHVRVLDAKHLGLKNLGPWPELVTDNGGIIELFSNGERMPLVRWPNQEPTTMKRVVDPGETAGQQRRGGVFEYRDDRSARWPIDAGVWLRGYWRVPWQIETLRVKAARFRQAHVYICPASAGRNRF